GATRQSNEVKKREEEILKLQEKMRQDEEARLKIEDERRRAESEIQKIQQTLESERSLALDKEDIFRRLQDRESELSEKLQGALEDQERLEDQLEALIEAKKRAEDQADEWHRQVEQATLIITKLEGEKTELNSRITALDTQLIEVEQSRSQTTELEEKLGQEIKMLQSHVSLKDRKLQDLEAKMLENDHELDFKLSSANKDVQESKKKIRDLVDENRSIRQQMSELASTSTSYEDLIRRKDSELAILKTDLKRFQDDRKRFEQEKQTLTSQHDN
ncbi:hypothetical protein KCU90_g26845, partial [Aureobasidium melanogenum]